MNFYYFDVAFIGAGPASMYAAYLLAKEKKDLKIAFLEKGKVINERSCPAIKNKKPCYHCPTCDIMSGVAGAGAFQMVN